jgi:hypothetical protein
VLAGSLVLGMVLALLAAAFAPAWSGSAFWVRVAAGVVGVGCVAGLVVLFRPRASVGAPGARPICPQCGFDLTDVPAEVSGRTTCPSCEMTWAFGRDRAAWREHGPSPRVGTPAGGADAPIPFSSAATTGARTGPARRSVRRARWRALTRWTAILILTLFLTGAGAHLLRVAVGGAGPRAMLTGLLLLGGVPILAVLVAGMVAFVRAGRG